MLLVAGFGLHNGTEGFGIMGASGKTPISGRDVFLLGLVAGAPTCIGTLLSGQEISPYFSISFYSLAAGSLLYVVLSLTAMSYTASRRMQAAVGIFIGISLMYLTAMVLTLVSGVRS
jgi:ZIP family zinc transporter